MADIKLAGNWKAGWAIDLHTVSSVALGGGHFDTEYTEIGEALNKLKYRDDYSQVPFLAEKAVEFLRSRKVTPYLKVIIPVPPSNLDRGKQPVFEVAKQIGSMLRIPLDLDFIQRAPSGSQLKSVDDPAERKKILKGLFKIQGLKYKDRKVLVFDDLYRSGATLNEITERLYQDGHVQNVYVLTLTKTRVKQ